MDIFVFDNVKAEKLKALLSYNRLQTLSNLFRLLEICLALVLLSWISARLPSVLRISGEYFRRLADILVSPLFIFVLSNVIVVTLLAKSGRLTSEPPAAAIPETHLYEDLIGDRAAVKPDLAPEPESPAPAPDTEEVSCEDKEIVSESKIASPENCGEKVLRRSQSENVKKAEEEPKGRKKLRRSETEMGRKAAAADPEELSTEEFNRTVEEFIAKQMRFHLEEKVAIVSCS